jgi:ankyrin repeat protein
VDFKAICYLMMAGYPEILPKEILAKILIYLPDESNQALIKSYSTLSKSILEINKDDLFWKERTELLLGKYLKLTTQNWKVIYDILFEVLQSKSLIINDDNLRELFYKLIGSNAVQIGDIKFTLNVYKHLNIIKSIFTSSENLEELRQLWLDDPMAYAIQFNNPDVITCLIEAGYDPSEDNFALCLAAINGNLDMVKTLLLDSRVDPSVDDNEALEFAALVGNTDIVSFLLKDPRITSISEYTLISAIKSGNPETLKVLLSDPRIDISKGSISVKLFRSAVEKNKLDIVNFLLSDSRFDPSLDDDVAIKIASKNGNLDIVKLLLNDPRVDPSSDNNYLIKQAAKTGKSLIVDILLRDPRINVFQEDTLNKKFLKQYIMKFIEDPLSGLVVMNDLYNTGIIDIYWSKNEINTGILTIIDVYYRFLRYLIKKRPSIIIAINKLIDLISNSDSSVKKIIHSAVKSILDPNIKLYLNTQINDFIYVFRGFLYLVYEPQYTHQKIIDILKNEGANNIALWYIAKLMGAYFGLSGLKKNGLVVTPYLSQINFVLSKFKLEELID